MLCIFMTKCSCLSFLSSYLSLDHSIHHRLHSRKMSVHMIHLACRTCELQTNPKLTYNAGVQNSSAKTTCDAAVSVTATPAAVMPSKAKRTLGSVWNLSICSCRLFGDVFPSILINLYVPGSPLLDNFTRCAMASRTEM